MGTDRGAVHSLSCDCCSPGATLEGPPRIASMSHHLGPFRGNAGVTFGPKVCCPHARTGAFPERSAGLVVQENHLGPFRGNAGVTFGPKDCCEYQSDGGNRSGGVLVGRKPTLPISGTGISSLKPHCTFTCVCVWTVAN